jgi:hypothetical protein
MPDAFRLVSIVDAPQARAAVTLGLNLPTEIAGQPVKYQWRKSIKLGNYKHPRTGQRVDVTPERMQRWMDNFRKMRANGHRVYVPVNHSSKSEDNRGFVLDMRRDGEWLEELHQYIGDDAARDAARSHISLNIVPGLRDCLGNVYDEAIEHSSLVVNPVILGQPEPSLAASAGDAPAGETYVLSATAQPAEGSTMNLTEAQIAAIAAAVGLTLAADTTGDALVARVTERVNAAATCETKLSAATAEIGTLKLAANAPRLEGVALSAMITAAERAKNHALAVGAINPPTADKLFAMLVRPAKDKANVLALSMSSVEGDANSAPVALAVFEAHNPVRR